MKENIKKYLTIANILTAMRLLGAIYILFLEPLSLHFYIVYTFCGLTDTFDGTIARATKTASKFGAKLDSIADISFYLIMLLKLIPVLTEILHIHVWITIFVVLAVRLVSYLISAIRLKKFASVHSYYNKATGALVFLTPYAIKLPYFNIYASIVCAVALFAAIDEIHKHLRTEKNKEDEVG